MFDLGRLVFAAYNYPAGHVDSVFVQTSNAGRFKYRDALVKRDNSFNWNVGRLSIQQFTVKYEVSQETVSGIIPSAL